MLHKQLEKFWQIENLETRAPLSQEEAHCEKHFVATHTRDDEGRFTVQLPLKENIKDLGESYGTAEKRLKSLERKLEKRPELKQQYHDFLKEYLELNHMEEVPSNEKFVEGAYYIPHHAVMKEDSTTTRTRVVFDASCKTTSGIALNNCLLTGPTIQDDLFDIILRLRQPNYAMSADVTKMYRQVNITKEMRHLQHILWR